MSLFKAARPYLWVVPILVLLGLTASIAEGIGIGLLVFLLQLMLGNAGATIGGSGLLDQVYKSAAAFVGNDVVIVSIVTISLIVTKSLLICGYNCLAAFMNAKLNDRLRRLAFKQLVEADYSYVSQREHGYFLNLISGESLRATEALTTIFQMGVNVCAMIIFGTMLLLISWQLVLVVAVGIGIASIITRLLVKRANRLGRTFTDAYGVMTGRVVSALNGMRILRVFGRESDEMRRFDHESARVRQSFLRVQFLKSATNPISEGLYLVVFVGIVAASVQLGTPLASVITFVVILARLQPQMKNFDWCRVHLSGFGAAAETIATFLDRPADKATPKGTLPFGGLKDAIQFRATGFNYPGETNPALRGVSFTVRKGQTTAIIGGSGAGKSTVINLLLRLYEPTSGEITADGIPISNFEMRSWRNRIAIAGQDADLLEGTILENVKYGRESATLAEVEDAAQMAGVLDFVQSLPEGWNTRVGERGLRLSGGQRQRLSLARALLRNPDILILDEATNALDSLLEAEIQSAISRISKHSTVVIIAHRLSTVVDSDHIVVLRNGEVAEDGPPESLLAKPDSLFNRFYETQDLSIGRARAANS